MDFVYPITDKWPSKRSSWWWHAEDVLKMTCGPLQLNIRFLPRCLQEVFKNVFQTHFEDFFGRSLANTSLRRLQGVLEEEKLSRWKQGITRIREQELFARVADIFCPTCTVSGKHDAFLIAKFTDFCSLSHYFLLRFC